MSRSRQTLAVEPVGGVGEMGHHHLLLDVGLDTFAIDCGMRMPGPDAAGIDKITPPFEPALERAEDGSLRALILTHGHLDHIGAVGDLLARLPDLPVYGTPWTLALLRRRLGRDEAALSKAPDLRPVSRGETARIGSADVTWLGVTHSLPDACSVAVQGDAGCVVHSGDFRIQEDPLLGPPSQRAAFERVGAAGVDLALVDSTSSAGTGATESERAIADRLADAVSDVDGYAVVTLFSSHIERLWACVLAARAVGRRVCVMGRSLAETAALAVERGVLPVESGELIPVDSLSRHPRDRVLLVVTGTQGEWRTPLARMAREEDSRVRLGPGDAVFWSARVIPGEERSVGLVVNRLVDLGVRVVPPWSRAAPPLHTSGHARWDEVAQWLDWVRPRHVVPIHGEPWHLESHRESLIEHLGSERVLTLRSGDRLTRAAPGASWLRESLAAHEPTLHGPGSVSFTRGDRALAARRRAGRSGVVAVFVRWTPAGLDHLEIATTGIVPDARSESFEASIRQSLHEELVGRRPALNPAARSEQVRLLVRGAIKKRTGTKPQCVVRLLS